MKITFSKISKLKKNLVKFLKRDQKYKKFSVGNYEIIFENKIYTK